MTDDRTQRPIASAAPLAEPFRSVAAGYVPPGWPTDHVPKSAAALATPATQQAEPNPYPDQLVVLQSAFAAAAPLVGEKAEPTYAVLRDALLSLDSRLRECVGLGLTADDAYDSFYQEIVAEALGPAPPAAEQAAPFDHAHPDSWKYEAKSEPLTREQAAALMPVEQAAPPQTPEPVAAEVVEDTWFNEGATLRSPQGWRIATLSEEGKKLWPIGTKLYATPEQAQTPEPVALTIRLVREAVIRDGNAEAWMALLRMEKLIATPEQAAPLPQGADARQAFELGWRTAANWTERDDLIADIGSPAYIADRDAAIAGSTTP